MSLSASASVKLVQSEHNSLGRRTSIFEFPALLNQSIRSISFAVFETSSSCLPGLNCFVRSLSAVARVESYFNTWKVLLTDFRGLSALLRVWSGGPIFVLSE